VVLAELDVGVITMAKKHLGAIHRDAFTDARLAVQIVDGLAFVSATTEQFDLIYLDLTDPVGPASALYTRSFFADLKRTLSESGALVLHIGSPFSHPARVSACVADLRAVFAYVTPYFTHIPTYGATWGFAIASRSMAPQAISAADLEGRLMQRGIVDCQYYNGDLHHAMMALPGYVKSLIG
jgi:spermidine synthase